MKTNRKPTPFRKNGITWIGKAEPGDKSRADFLSDISHEIRTPIGAIVGLTDLLLTTKLDDKQKQCLMDENKKDRQENIIYLDTSAKRHLMNVKSEM